MEWYSFSSNRNEWIVMNLLPADPNDRLVEICSLSNLFNVNFSNLSFQLVHIYDLFSTQIHLYTKINIGLYIQYAYW